MSNMTESHIEDAFLHEFRKHTYPAFLLTAQVEFQTRVGMLRPDFVTEFDGYLIAFECDGREFHEDFRDEVRDAILLGDNHVGTIYRFDGAPLYYAPEVCIQFIMKHDPELFPPRSHEVINNKVAIADYKRAPIFHRRSSKRPHVKREHWPFIYRRFVEGGFTGVDDYSPGEPRIF